MKKNWKKICLFLLCICIVALAIIYIFLNNKTEDANNKSIAIEKVNQNENDNLKDIQQDTLDHVAKQLNTKNINKQSDLKEFKQIANISQCSEEFMNEYFSEVNALNEKISKEDEETRQRNKI